MLCSNWLKNLFIEVLLVGGFFNSLGQSATYFVATTGSDSNAGTISSPFKTINKGLSALKSGDTLYIRGGTYPEHIQNGIPSGTSWDTATKISNYNNEDVIIQPRANYNVVYLSGCSYIIFDGIILDGKYTDPAAAYTSALDGFKCVFSTAAGPAGAAHHIRAINCEMRYVWGQGINSTRGTHHCEFINNKIHDNGVDNHCHGMYVGGSYLLIDGNDIYNNFAQGLQIFDNASDAASWPANYCTVRNNSIHHNAHGVGTDRGTGIIIGTYSTGIRVYNNDVHDNKGGIWVDWNASNTEVYNNNVHNNWGAQVSGIYAGGGAKSANIHNNNIHDNHDGVYIDTGATNTTVKDNNLCGPLVNKGTGSIIVNNTCNGTAIPPPTDVQVSDSGTQTPIITGQQPPVSTPPSTSMSLPRGLPLIIGGVLVIGLLMKD